MHLIQMVGVCSIVMLVSEKNPLPMFEAKELKSDILGTWDFLRIPTTWW